MKKQSTLKRALALGMSATMVGATLAGCGGSPPLRQQPLQKLHRLQPLRRK